MDFFRGKSNNTPFRLRCLRTTLCPVRWEQINLVKFKNRSETTKLVPYYFMTQYLFCSTCIIVYKCLSKEHKCLQVVTGLVQYLFLERMIGGEQLAKRGVCLMFDDRAIFTHFVNGTCGTHSLSVFVQIWHMKQSEHELLKTTLFFMHSQVHTRATVAHIDSISETRWHLCKTSRFPSEFYTIAPVNKKVSMMLLYCLVLSWHSAGKVLLKSYGIQLQKSDMKEKKLSRFSLVMGTFMTVAIPPICTWHSCLWKIVIMWTSWDSLKKRASLFFKTIFYMQASYRSDNWAKSVMWDMLNW